MKTRPDHVGRLTPAAMILLLLACQLYGQETAESDADEFISLLEFIGEFTLNNGEWISPEQLEREVRVLADSSEGNVRIDTGEQSTRSARTNERESL